MGLGWFDAIAGAALPIATGLQQGRLGAEELERKRAEDALRRQLLQLQIEKAQQPEPWQPHSLDEYLQAHPDRTPPDYTPAELGERARAEHPDRFRTPEEAARYARAEFPERFRPPAPSASQAAKDASEEEVGLGILNSTLVQPGQKQEHPEVAGPFAQAFRSIRSEHPELQPGTVANRAMAGLHASRPDLFRQPSEEELYQRAQHQQEPEDSLPAAGHTPPAAASSRPSIESRVQQLKAAGLSKDAAFQTLQAEGYLDAQGNVR